MLDCSDGALILPPAQLTMIVVLVSLVILILSISKLTFSSPLKVGVVILVSNLALTPNVLDLSLTFMETRAFIFPPSFYPEMKMSCLYISEKTMIILVSLFRGGLH